MIPGSPDTQWIRSDSATVNILNKYLNTIYSRCTGILPRAVIFIEFVRVAGETCKEE